MRKVIEASGAGLIIDAANPREIARAVNTLLADPALRDRMAENARQARAQYCWEREEHKLRDLYAGYRRL
jgi:glycosyltransferase involved in cell wall biosynthesis